MTKAVTFGGITVEPCSKRSGFVPVAGTENKLPVTVINGKEEGKTLLLTAGIHGGEYPGIQAAMELGRELDPKEMRGQLVIISPVNTEAFFKGRARVIPTDGKNLNRLFPGDKEGTIGDRIAYTVTHEFQDKSDFYIDMHGGDIPLLLSPYVYFPGVGENKEALSYAEEASKYVLSAVYRVKSQATTGAYNSCAIRGVPSLLIELGAAGVWSREEVDAYKRDIINIMKFLNILDGKPVRPEKEAALITKVVYDEADEAGCWYPLVDVKDKVKKGDRLGVLTDLFGNVLKEYYARFDAEIIYKQVSLGVDKGDGIMTYGGK